MKRMIDVKSLVIGVLATALFFTIVGAKSKNTNFDTITAKKIKIVNSEGKTVADLGSVLGKRSLFIYNKEKNVVGLRINEEEGFDIHNKEGKRVAGLRGSKEGVLDIYNKHGKEVVTVQANKDSDDAIVLYDRYGNYGWGMTGKK
jgi:hypothetical protein